MPDAVTAAVRNAEIATPQAAAERRSQKLNDRFLTLLVAQMKNQTPLNPMDSSDVTSQIAQVNTVSGINKLNETLGAITEQINTSQRLQASALIGHQVLVDGDHVGVYKVESEEGDDRLVVTPFGYELDKPARNVEIEIINTQGETVFHGAEVNRQPGVYPLQWDGKDGSDNPVDGGDYTVLVKATDADGEPVDVKALEMRVVNGVIVTDSEPKLDLGPNGGTAMLDDIRQIIS